MPNGHSAVLIHGRGSDELDLIVQTAIERKGSVDIAPVSFRDFGNQEIGISIAQSIRRAAMSEVAYYNGYMSPEHNFSVPLKNGKKSTHSIEDLLMQFMLFGDAAQNSGARHIVGIISSAVYESNPEFIGQLLWEAGYSKLLLVQKKGDRIEVDGNPVRLDIYAQYKGERIKQTREKLPLDMQPALVAGPDGSQMLYRILKQNRRKVMANLPGYYVEFGKDSPTDLVSLRSDISHLKDKDVYYITCCYDPTHPELSINDNFMRALVFAQEAKKAGAKRVNAIIPFLPYARQDRHTKRDALSLKLVADMLLIAGYDTAITTGLHSKQGVLAFERGFNFEDIPTERILIDQLKDYPSFFGRRSFKRREFYLITTDGGGQKVISPVAGALGVYFTKTEKWRRVAEKVEGIFIPERIADVYGILVDDMIAGGGTIDEVARYAAKKKRVRTPMGVTVVHYIGNNSADDTMRRLYAEGLVKRVYGSDSVPRTTDWLRENKSWYTQYSLSPILLNTIKVLNTGGSMHDLVEVKK